MISLNCQLYRKFFLPYIDGRMGDVHPFFARRLTSHLNNCSSCRYEIRNLASTHSHLRNHVRTGRKIESEIQKQTARTSSIADRVFDEISNVERENRRQKRATMQLVYAAVCVGTILIVLSTPSPAREWIYTQILHVQPAKSVVAIVNVPAPAPLQLVPVRDPMAAPIDKAVLTASNIKPAISSMPPPPPIFQNTPVDGFSEPVEKLIVRNHLLPYDNRDATGTASANGANVAPPAGASAPPATYGYSSPAVNNYTPIVTAGSTGGPPPPPKFASSYDLNNGQR